MFFKMNPASFIFLLWLFLFRLPLALSATPQGVTVSSYRASFLGQTDAFFPVDRFLGIPYARPPTGSLRLQPPVGLKNKGTVNATRYGAQCFQMDPPRNVNISEDCLTLNIFKPSHQTLKGLPILFWIHGGGFNDGSGSIYDARSLVNRSIELGSPVIVVTINYRLSFLGFPAGKDAIANNALNVGLLDQRAALQWVHDYISYFGGDPHKVTIFGQSAGATSIGLQMTGYDGDYEDLFRAAILESGSPQDTSPTPPPTWAPWQSAWDAVVKGLNCTNSTHVFSCVQNAPEQALFRVITSVGKAKAPLPSSTYPWQPVIDGDLVSDFPSKLLAGGKFLKIPTIVGFTTDEVTYVIPTAINISSEAVLAQLAGFVLSWVPNATLTELIALEKLSDHPNIYGVGGTQWKRAAELASDLFERCPGIAFARNVTQFAPIWKYRLNAIIPAQLAQAPYQGIVHSAEIPYVYGPSISPFVNETIDIELSRVVQKAWISFASYLNPNTLGDLEPGVAWPSYENKTELVLVFQKNDGSALGSQKGQGSHIEKDKDDKEVCDFIIGRDADFVH